MSLFGYGTATTRKLQNLDSSKKKVQEQERERRRRREALDALAQQDKAVDELVKRLEKLELSKETERTKLKTAASNNDTVAKNASYAKINQLAKQISAVKQRLGAATPAPARPRPGPPVEEDDDEDDDDFVVRDLLVGDALRDARQEYAEIQRRADELNIKANLLPIGPLDLTSGQEWAAYKGVANRLIAVEDNARKANVARKADSVRSAVNELTADQYNQFAQRQAVQGLFGDSQATRQALRTNQSTDNTTLRQWLTVEQELVAFTDEQAKTDEEKKDLAFTLADQLFERLRQVRRLTEDNNTGSDIDLAQPKAFENETGEAALARLRAAAKQVDDLERKTNNQVKQLANLKARAAAAQQSIEELANIDRNDIAGFRRQEASNLDAGTLEEQIANYGQAARGREDSLRELQVLSNLRKQLGELQTELRRYDNAVTLNTRPPTIDGAGRELTRGREELARLKTDVASQAQSARESIQRLQQQLDRFENRSRPALRPPGQNDTPLQELTALQTMVATLSDALRSAQDRAANQQFDDSRRSLDAEYVKAADDAEAAGVQRRDIARPPEQGDSESNAAFVDRYQAIIDAIRAQQAAQQQQNAELAELQDRITQLENDLGGYGELDEFDDANNPPEQTVAGLRTRVAALRQAIQTAQDKFEEEKALRVKNINDLNDQLDEAARLLVPPDQSDTPLGYLDELDDVVNDLQGRLAAKQAADAAAAAQAKEDKRLRDQLANAAENNDDLLNELNNDQESERSEDEEEDRMAEEQAAELLLQQQLNEAQQALGNETDAERAEREKREAEIQQQFDQLNAEADKRDAEALKRAVADEQIERELKNQSYARIIVLLPNKSRYYANPTDTKSSTGKQFVQAVFAGAVEEYKDIIGRQDEGNLSEETLAKVNSMLITPSYTKKGVARQFPKVKAVNPDGAGLEIEASLAGVLAACSALCRPLLQQWASATATDAAALGYKYWTDAVVPVLTEMATDLHLAIESLRGKPDGDDDTPAAAVAQQLPNAERARKLLRQIVQFMLVKGLTGHEATDGASQTPGAAKNTYFDDLVAYTSDPTIRTTVTEPDETTNQLLREIDAETTVGPLLKMINLFAPNTARRYNQNADALVEIKVGNPGTVKLLRIDQDNAPLLGDGQLDQNDISLQSYEAVVARVLALPVLDVLYYDQTLQYGAVDIRFSNNRTVPFVLTSQLVDQGFSPEVSTKLAVLPAFFKEYTSGFIGFRRTQQPIAFVNEDRLFVDPAKYKEEALKSLIVDIRQRKGNLKKSDSVLKALAEEEFASDQEKGLVSLPAQKAAGTTRTAPTLIVQPLRPANGTLPGSADNIVPADAPVNLTKAANVNLGELDDISYVFVAALTQFANLRDLFDRVTPGVISDQQALEAMHKIMGTVLFTPVVLRDDENAKSLFQRYGRRPAFIDNRDQKQFLKSAGRPFLALQSQFKLADLVPRSIKQRVKRNTLDQAIVKNDSLTNVQEVKKVLRNEREVPEYDQVIEELSDTPLRKRTFLVPSDSAVQFVLESVADRRLSTTQIEELLSKALRYHILDEQVFFDETAKKQSLDGVSYDTEYALTLSDGRKLPVPMNIFVDKYDKRTGGDIIINGNNTDVFARVKVSKPYLAANGVYYIVSAVADFSAREAALRRQFNVPETATVFRDTVGATLPPPPAGFVGQYQSLPGDAAGQVQSGCHVSGGSKRKAGLYSVEYAFIRFGNDDNFEAMAAALELVPEPRRPGEPFVYTNASGLRVEFLSDMRTQAYYTDDDRTQPSVVLELPLDEYVYGGKFTAPTPDALRAVDNYLTENDYERRIKSQIRAVGGGYGRMQTGAAAAASVLVDDDDDNQLIGGGGAQSANDYLAEIDALTPDQIVASAAEAENICASLLSASAAEGRAQNERDFEPWRQALEASGVLASIEDMARDSESEPLHIFAPTPQALKRAKLTPTAELLQAHVGVGRYPTSERNTHIVTPISAEELYYIMQRKEPVALDTLNPSRQITHLPLTADKAAATADDTLHFADIQFRQPPHKLDIVSAAHPVHVHFIERVLHTDLAAAAADQPSRSPAVVQKTTKTSSSASAATGGNKADKLVGKSATTSADHWLAGVTAASSALAKSRDPTEFHAHIDQLDTHLTDLGGAHAVLLSASAVHVQQALKALRSGVARNRYIDGARKSAAHRAIDDLSDRFPSAQ